MKVNKPINLAQLDKEFNGKGLNATLDENRNIVEVTLTEHNDGLESDLQAAINAHIAIDDNAVKAAEKAALLAQLGITEEQAKLLLS